MQIADIPREFLDLPWQSLEHIAKWHDRMARAARERAKTVRENTEREESARQRVEYMANSYKTVLEYLSKGYNSPESAIAAAARELDLPEFTVLGWWKNWLKRRDAEARAERNRIIVDLVRLGMTNQKIAARLGIHPNTVTRAINNYLFAGFRPSDRARLLKRRKHNVQNSKEEKSRTFKLPENTGID